MNAALPPSLARAMVSMAPAGSEVHQIIDANPVHPLPVCDPLPPEMRAAFDRIFLMDRDASRLRSPFPGEQS